MKGKIFIILGIILVLVCCGVGALHFMENYEAVYYSKIDNTKVEELSTSDDLKYKYTLDCYNESGTKKELKFKTYRELKEGAYILLEVRAFEVHKWEEVKYNDLPQAVQEKIK